MPFSLFGPSPGYLDFQSPSPSPAPAGGGTSLTLADLFQPSADPSYPEPPAPYQRYADTGPDANANLRRQAILRIAAALGGDSGHIGTNLAGAALSLDDWQKSQLDEARTRQQQDFATSTKQADLEAQHQKTLDEDAQRKQKAEGQLAAIRSVAEQDPDLAKQAESYAMAGDEAGMREVVKEANRRRASRARGEDPNDPFADERAKAKIQTEAEKERLDLQNQSQQSLDMYWRTHGKYQAPPQYEPLDRVRQKAEIEASVRDAHLRSTDPALKPRIGQGPGGLWGLISPDPGGGPPSFTAATGQRTDSKGFTHILIGPNPYIMDNTRPELGFYPAPVHDEKGAVMPARQDVRDQVKQVAGRLGRPLTVDESRQAESQLIGGQDVLDVVAGLKAPKPIAAPDKAPTEGKLSGPPPPQIRNRAQQGALQAAARAKGFDLAGARQKGWSDAEIANFLGVQ